MKRSFKMSVLGTSFILTLSGVFVIVAKVHAAQKLTTPVCFETTDSFPPKSVVLPETTGTCAGGIGPGTGGILVTCHTGTGTSCPGGWTLETGGLAWTTGCCASPRLNASRYIITGVVSSGPPPDGSYYLIPNP
jgi:hypothetical protein